MPRIQSYRVPLAAFTLIELLVVISIIAMLVALLLPALSAARATAAAAQCLGNQRTMAIAMQNYTNDFKGVSVPVWKINNQALPPSNANYKTYTDFSKGPTDIFNGIPTIYPGTTTIAGWTWHAYLNGYIGALKTFHCPSSQVTSITTASMQGYADDGVHANSGNLDGRAIYPLAYNYGINAHLYGSTYTARLWVVTDRIQKPSDVAFVFDYGFYSGGNNGSLSSGSLYGVFPGLFAQPTTAVMHGSLAGKADYAMIASTSRHPSSTITASFHDGHAARIAVRDLQNPDLGGTNGYLATGNTELGKKFRGRYENVNKVTFLQK